MPRAKATCGTYTAYKRHLKEKVQVDSACREAQRAHDDGRSTSGAARVARAAKVAKPAAAAPDVPLAPAPVTDEGHVSRVEILKEMLEESRELVKTLRRNDPQRAYLQMREQREILRELSELQGNGQVKGVTLNDQLAEARARRLAAAEAS